LSNNKHIKKWLVVALWTVAVSIGGFFVLVAFRSGNNKNCSSVAVEIAGAGSDRFITEAEIREQVTATGVTDKMPVSAIDIRMLEDKLERNPWIKNAELYIDNKAALNIHITENTPVLRVFDVKDNSYYLDATGAVMPVISAYTAKLPVFTGYNPADSTFTGQVLAMASYIEKNPFWKAQVQQVEIQKNHQFILTPSLGDHLVYFGDTVMMENKFNRLYQYYTKVAPKAGFNRYLSLNVQYAGQLVALNRNAANVAIDTVSARRVIRNLIDNGQVTPDSGRIVNNVLADSLVMQTNNRPVVAAPPPARTVTAPVRNNTVRPNTVPKPRPVVPQRHPRAVMRRPAGGK
jgi:cell division protein FtsQ